MTGGGGPATGRSRARTSGPGTATSRPGRRSCAHIRGSRSAPRTCWRATPPTPRRPRRTDSSRRSARSGASGAARRSSRGCCGSSPTRLATAAARRAAASGSSCARSTRPARGTRSRPPRRRSSRARTRSGCSRRVERLPDDHRDAIACRYLLELSEEETAAALGDPSRDGQVAPRARPRAPAREPGGRGMSSLEQRLQAARPRAGVPAGAGSRRRPRARPAGRSRGGGSRSRRQSWRWPPPSAVPQARTVDPALLPPPRRDDRAGRDAARGAGALERGRPRPSV